MSDDYDYDYDDTTKTLHAITRPRLRKAKAAVKSISAAIDVMRSAMISNTTPG